MAESRGQKRKVRWIIGAQSGKAPISVSPPATRRMARKGTLSKEQMRTLGISK